MIKKLFLTIVVLFSFSLSYNLYSKQGECYSIESIENAVHPIKITGQIKDLKIGSRSLDTVDAYLHNNIITIDFNVYLINEVINILVYDINGECLYNDSFLLDKPCEISFPFEQSVGESYRLEIKSNCIDLIGEF